VTLPTLGLPLDRERPLLPQVREARYGELLVAVVASVLGGCILAATGDVVAFILLAMAACLAVGALRPALFLALVILVRPLLDDFTDVTIGVRSANAGGALAVALVLATALIVARRRPATWPRAASVLVIVIAFSVVSAVQARQELGPDAGIEAVAEVVRLSALLAAYVLAANVVGSPEQARRLFLIFGVSAVVPALIGIAEWIKGPEIPQGLAVPRVSGPFVGPGPFGTFLAVAALIVMFLPDPRLRPSLRLGCALVLCAPLLATSSREAWFIFVGGVVLLGWRARPRLVATVTVVVVALLLLVPAVRDRALPTPARTGTAATDASYASLTWRLENWSGLLDEWRAQPVFGHGLRSTTSVNPLAPIGTLREPAGGFAAHSLPVRLLVEGGVVLLTAYAAFFVALMRSVHLLARERWELQPLGRLLWAIWTLLLIASVSMDDALDGTALIISLLALTGSLEAAQRVMRQDADPSAAGRSAR
jgi:O-antigen ligase